ncbi:MAG: spiro-SPASM protein [Treponema sp.]|nr:spiro-SPASM protein [Treponema sp.]
MNSILILYAGNINKYAIDKVFNDKNAIQLSVEQAMKFPGVSKTVLLAPRNGDFSFLTGVQLEQRDKWTKKSALEKIAELEAGFDLTYFAFADCPFLDPALAGALARRHTRYNAEYSYSDGFPFGLSPEILSPGTAAILSKIISGDDGHVERDMLFSVIQKDINAFDIETEISNIDHRCHRINLSADSKRDLMLLKNFYSAAGGKIPSADDAEQIIEKQSAILRTLPVFFPVQVYGGCPQKCVLCPYPLFTDVINRKDFMSAEKFESLLDKITDFSDDAVIDLSLWGELSLHPEKIKLIEAVLSRRNLALVIETSGVGWKIEELEKCARLALNAKKDSGGGFPSSISWIVSLDTTDPNKYAHSRGAGFAEAENRAKKLLSLFPDDCYVQAVRYKGSEDDTQKFYRYWKDASSGKEKNIIIQKYDDFCGVLESKQASDISPVIRQSCWHIMRDFPVLIDGTVPLCKENLSPLKGEKDLILGNAFSDNLSDIWKNGEKYYLEHSGKNFSSSLLGGLCEKCDEYYTYNF